MLLVHIIVALISLSLSTYVWIKPSRRVLEVAYMFIGGTITSGIYLFIVDPASLHTLCGSGVIYSVAVLAGVGSARAKLAYDKWR